MKIAEADVPTAITKGHSKGCLVDVWMAVPRSVAAKEDEESDMRGGCTYQGKVSSGIQVASWNYRA